MTPTAELHPGGLGFPEILIIFAVVLAIGFLIGRAFGGPKRLCRKCYHSVPQAAPHCQHCGTAIEVR